MRRKDICKCVMVDFPRDLLVDCTRLQAGKYCVLLFCSSLFILPKRGTKYKIIFDEMILSIP